MSNTIKVNGQSDVSSGSTEFPRPAHVQQCIDDIWTTFPNVHLRILTAENDRIEIQICDCGMSGHCQPQAFARIEKHNRDRVANAIGLDAPREPSPKLEFVLRNAHRLLRMKYKGRPLWSLVRDVSGCGSTVSRKLCARYGWDADQDGAITLTGSVASCSGIRVASGLALG